MTSDWLALGFTLDDDRFDTGKLSARPEKLAPLMMQFMHAIDHPEGVSRDDPYMEPLRELSRRVRQSAGPTAAHRWAEGMAQWLNGALTVATYRAAGIFPTFEEYLLLGPRDRGSRASFALIEAAERRCLSAAAMESAPGRALFEMASLLVLLVSDLYSFRREQRDGTLQSNAVAILMRDKGWPLPESLTYTGLMHDQVMTWYWQYRNQQLGTSDEAWDAYIGQLDHWVASNLYWHLSVPRYHVEIDVSAKMPASTAVSRDAPLSGEVPLHLPESSRWWMELAQMARDATE